MADSTYDSPYRSGRHIPLANGRHSILTSVTTAAESRTDVNAPYRDDSARSSSNLDLNGGMSPYTPTSPVARPYSPGMRSQTARQSQSDGFEVQGQTEMQSFENGLPPAPPVLHSWKKIDSWADENYPELFDQICEGATNNDINDLEHQLNCSLPADVRASLMVHDGQERGGIPTGIVFGSMLLDCEEIVQEWDNWRKVNQEFLMERAINKPPVPSKVHAGNGGSSAGGSSNHASSSRSVPSPRSSQNGKVWRQDLQSRQDCCPPNAVQKVYAHVGWIPLVRDWGGNNLAVDLAPGPTGKWGQIILFGRDYDTKYVVAQSWSHFLGLLADDLNSGKWFVDEETNELKLREFKQARVEPSYFDILRWRMDQKYGRRAAKRKSAAPPNKGGSPASLSPAASPYMSPTEPTTEVRGRTMPRGNGSSPLVSPKPALGKPSPLSRVTEEAASPPPLQTVGLGLKPPKLVEVETPHQSEDDASPRLAALTRCEPSPAVKGKEIEASVAVKMNGKQPEQADDTMKTIEI